MNTVGFLVTPEVTAEAQRLLDDDVAELGYVMNGSRLWGYQPATVAGLFDLMGLANATDRLSLRQRGILVTACASAFGDAYCALSWGGKLAGLSDAETAAGVIAGTDEGLTDAERAMADWARRVVRNPNATTAGDVQRLRDAGFTDSQIFTMTVFVALRLAFSTVNDALGIRPDRALHDGAPDAVRDAVTFGRPVDDPS
jgi:alkylhydroperoxidase family enzyme